MCVCFLQTAVSMRCFILKTYISILYGFHWCSGLAAFSMAYSGLSPRDCLDGLQFPRSRLGISDSQQQTEKWGANVFACMQHTTETQMLHTNEDIPCTNNNKKGQNKG